MGTNSFLLLVVIYDGRDLRTLRESKRDPRLGTLLHKENKIDRGAILRGKRAIDDLIAEASPFNPDRIVITGSEIFRRVKNIAQLTDYINETYKVHVKVLTVQEEARYAYLGAKNSLDLDKNCLIVDVGGGSTEFILCENGDKIQYFSVSIGAVYLFEKIKLTYPLNIIEFNKMLKYIDDKVGNLPWKLKVEQLIGSGGTITTFGAVLSNLDRYESRIVHGREAGLEEICESLNIYKHMSLAQLEQLIFFDKKRADIFLPGLCIFFVLMKKFGFDKIIINDKGVRWGIIWELINNFT
ncbi:hypothetical protein JXI42_11805 [bacterium]|nr:hypothetical protein [bacterium]